MASHPAQDALACQDFGRTYAGQRTDAPQPGALPGYTQPCARTPTVPADRTSQATALRHSARRTTTSTTATASARTNVPFASRSMLSVGREHPEGIRSLILKKDASGG
jgi:hypothetical protein